MSIRPRERNDVDWANLVHKSGAKVVKVWEAQLGAGGYETTRVFIELDNGYYDVYFLNSSSFNKEMSERGARNSGWGKYIDGQRAPFWVRVDRTRTTSEGQCTCPDDVWKIRGCKCGAITPYKLTFV